MSAPAKKPWRRRLLPLLLRLYPPYVGAGVRVTQADPEGGVFEVAMRLRFWNQNYLGTHFGGSLYSMCDPFFVLILSVRLGAGYVVWDKAATIRFRRPGKGLVRARFAIGDDEVARIRAAADAGEIVEPTFAAQVQDAEGRVVAEIEKVLHVRRATPKKERAGAPATR